MEKLTVNNCLTHIITVYYASPILVTNDNLSHDFVFQQCSRSSDVLLVFRAFVLFVENVQVQAPLPSPL